MAQNFYTPITLSNINWFLYFSWSKSGENLDDALKPATPMTNGTINQMLQQFAPLCAPELSWIVSIDKPSMKDPLKQHNRQDLSSEATCQAQSTLIMQLVIVVTGLSAMSDISQGSVTTHMRCGGIFSVNVTINFLLIPPVKEFWKSVNIWWSYWHIKILCHFLAHPVCYALYKSTVCSCHPNPFPEKILHICMTVCVFTA